MTGRKISVADRIFLINLLLSHIGKILFRQAHFGLAAQICGDGIKSLLSAIVNGAAPICDAIRRLTLRT